MLHDKLGRDLHPTASNFHKTLRLGHSRALHNSIITQAQCWLPATMASAVPSGSQLMTLDQHANQCETRMRQPFNMQNAVFRKGDAPLMMFYSSDASDAPLLPPASLLLLLPL